MKMTFTHPTAAHCMVGQKSAALVGTTVAQNATTAIATAVAVVADVKHAPN